MLLGIPATLSVGPLADITLFGKNFFDLFDFISSNLLLPLGGIGIALVIGWRLKKESFLEEVEKGRTGRKAFSSALYVSVKRPAPIAIAVVLLNGLGVI